MIGLTSSWHCAGMCGGIVGTLTNFSHNNRALKIRALLGYNLGRVFSYACAGAIAGFIGSRTLSVFSMQQAHSIGTMISGLFLIALGLYVTGWWTGLTVLERVGGYIWRYLSPMLRRLLPPKSFLHILLAGMLWGWLPCGLVYAVLIWSSTSGSPLSGALIMIAFGLGTLPMISALVFTNRFIQTKTTLQIRRFCGFAIISFGVLMFLGQINLAHANGKAFKTNHAIFYYNLYNQTS